MHETVFLVGPSQRTYAKSLIDKAGPDIVMVLRKSTRTIAQNAKMHAMLNDVARRN